MRTFKNFRPAMVVAALLCWFAQCQAEEPPKLPDGIEELTPDIKEQLAKLCEAAQKFRGLKLKQPVAMGQLGRNELKAKVLDEFAKELPPEKIDPLQRTLKAFDLIPGDMNLGKYYPELLTSQIGGYYDPHAKYLVLVKGKEGMLGAAAEKRFGPKLMKKMEETVLVHEINHAIQDQHFNLETFGHDGSLSDEACAKLALVEGDATLVMYGYMLGLPMERMPGIEMLHETANRDTMDLVGAMPEMPGAEELAKAPAYLRENLTFSYIQGLYFCIRLRQTGGQRLLDYAFQKDPPRSTEQIMHPEKWLEQRDDPVKIEFPDLTAALPGYQKVSGGTWGEFNIRLQLFERLGKAGRNQSEIAAAGWGGDAFAQYAKGKEEVVLWITEWDTPKDAEEFATLAKTAYKSEDGWTLASPNRTRVTLIRGKLSAEELAALQKRLAEAKAAQPANKNLDLAAVGITEADKPKSLSLEDYQGILNQPEMKDLMAGLLGGDSKDGKLDLAEALKSPEAQKMLKQFMGDGKKIDDLLKNPEVKGLLEKMLEGQKNLPKGEAADGKYVNKELGFSFSQPKGDEWKFDPDPPANPMGVKPLALLTSASGARIVLAAQPLPIQLPIDQLSAAMEMGMKFRMPDYKSIKSGLIDTGLQKGLEMEFTGTDQDAGAKVHMLQRLYIIDGKLIVLAGGTEAEAWEKSGKAIKECIESIEFIKK